MILVPAIDLRDGCCVQLRGGDYDQELVRLDDPVAVGRTWRERGAVALHVVDLDAATGRGANDRAVADLCGLDGLEVHVGGGLRSDERVAWALGLGARSCVVGTKAVDEPAWLAQLADRHPDRVSLAVDVRAGRTTTQGWRRDGGPDPIELVGRLDALGLHQVVLTAVDVEGSTAGPDLALLAAVRAATRHRLAYAGGVGQPADLAALAAAGADAVVVGTALYTGALELEGLSEELAP